MHSREIEPYDEARVTTVSRRFGVALFTRFPELRRQATMACHGEGEPWRLVVRVPAFSGDPRSELTVWIDESDEPSVAFGAWHTHESVWGAGLEKAAASAALLDLIAGIFADRFVLCADVGGIADGTPTVLDLHEDEALVEELTSPHSLGRSRIRSWSGRLDREIGLDDPPSGGPA